MRNRFSFDWTTAQRKTVSSLYRTENLSHKLCVYVWNDFRYHQTVSKVAGGRNVFQLTKRPTWLNKVPIYYTIYNCNARTSCQSYRRHTDRKASFPDKTFHWLGNRNCWLGLRNCACILYKTVGVFLPSSQYDWGYLKKRNEGMPKITVFLNVNDVMYRFLFLLCWCYTIYWSVAIKWRWFNYFKYRDTESESARQTPPKEIKRCARYLLKSFPRV